MCHIVNHLESLITIHLMLNFGHPSVTLICHLSSVKVADAIYGENSPCVTRPVMSYFMFLV